MTFQFHMHVEKNMDYKQNSSFNLAFSMYESTSAWE